MHRWIKKLHMYTGLLNFSILVIFGIVGLAATLLPPPNERTKPDIQTRFIDFKAPGNLDDRQLADQIHATLKLPLTDKAPPWGVRRDRHTNQLRINFFTPAKQYQVEVLEGEGRLRIDTVPFDVLQFLFHLHELTPRHAHTAWRTRLWAYYVEFSLWSLIGMAVSGVYLWLASRPLLRWAQMSFAAGAGIFVMIYVLAR